MLAEIYFQGPVRGRVRSWSSSSSGPGDRLFLRPHALVVAEDVSKPNLVVVRGAQVTTD